MAKFKARSTKIETSTEFRKLQCSKRRAFPFGNSCFGICFGFRASISDLALRTDGSFRRSFGFTKNPPHLAEGLAEAVFVFDQGHSDVPFAGGAKAAARANRDVGLFKELHGEINGR